MRRLVIVMCFAIAAGCAEAPKSEPPPAAASAAQPAPPAPAPPAPAPAPPAPAAQPVPGAAPVFREVTIPSGTTITIALRTAVASDQSKIEDRVEGRIVKPVMVKGVEALPADTAVMGTVTDAQQSGRVKGRARVALRFNRLTAGDESYDINAAAFTRVARATKASDARKIGIGAGAGAAVGAILGGKKGAAIGAGVGGGAGTGAVLATRGEEVRLPAGTQVTIRLRAPLTVRAKQ